MKNQFYIQHPCHQNWDKMNPTEKGKFCKSCKKEVLNFDTLDVDLLAKKLKQNAESVCIKTTIETPIQSNIWLKRLKYFVLSILFFLWFGSKKVLAQLRIDENGNTTYKQNDTAKMYTVVLTGKTVESLNTLIWVEYVQINLKKDDEIIAKIFSDKYGNFSFNKSIQLHTDEKLSLETIDSNYKKYDSLITFNTIDAISDTNTTLTSFVLIPLGNKIIIDAMPVRAIISMGSVRVSHSAGLDLRTIQLPKSDIPSMGRVRESHTLELDLRSTQLPKSNLPRIYNTQSNDLIVPMPRQ